MSFSKLINIGCGTTTHPDWINIDVAPALPGVVKVNIIEGLPYPSEFADVCYSSHMLEHLDKLAAHSLISECFRVLKSGGIVRLAVPDLEVIAREYLSILEELSAGVDGRELDYDWIMLELYDQAVRNVTGGEMAQFLINLNEQDRIYVNSRIGLEAEKVWESNRVYPQESLNLKFLFKQFIMKKFDALRESVAGVLVYLIAGKNAYRSFKVGIFRNSGEIHKWMYDKYSLKRLLENAGFINIKVCEPGLSQISNFSDYALEVLNGKVRKPDSICIEGTKP